MAIGKSRSNKRSTGGSCSSLVTTVMLVSVCVLGVWVIASNSTRRAATRINSSIVDSLLDIERHYVNAHRKIPVDVSKAEIEERSSVPEEDPRDDESSLGDDLDTVQETDQDYKVEEEENSGDDEAESLNDSDFGKEEAEQLQEEVKDEEIEVSDLVVEDGSEGKEEEKPNTINGDQETKETSGDVYDQEDKQTETGSEDDIQDLEDNQEQEINDEEQEKTMENEQEKGDTGQDQAQHEEDGPIQSHSIATKMKAQLETQEAEDVRNKMEQAKIEPMIEHIVISNKPSIKSNSTVIGITTRIKNGIAREKLPSVLCRSRLDTEHHFDGLPKNCRQFLGFHGGRRLELFSISGAVSQASEVTCDF